MLTPIEIQGKSFKTGFGFDKKEVESYLNDIRKDYEVLYKENMEMTEKINVLSEGVQYYKSIEKTLQKALVLAQKAAQETETAAKEKAEHIISTATEKAALTEREAKQQAKTIKTKATEQANATIAQAREELERIQADVANLLQQYDKYKIQYKQLINTQLEILDSPAYNVDYSNFKTYNTFVSSKLPMTETEEEEEEDTVEEAIIEETTVEEPTVEEASVEEAEEIAPIAIKVKVEEELPEEETVEEKVEDDDFIPTIDLTGILGDELEEEQEVKEEQPQEDVSVSDHGMKEIMKDKTEKPVSDLDRTLNEMSEKELLLKLFSNVGDSKLKSDNNDTKSDFEFLDL